MHDVVRKIVIARGNKYFGSTNAVRTVRVGLGTCIQQSNVGPAMRLGQAHGSSPFSRYKTWQKRRLQVIRTVRIDGIDSRP